MQPAPSSIHQEGKPAGVCLGDDLDFLTTPLQSGRAPAASTSFLDAGVAGASSVCGGALLAVDNFLVGEELVRVRFLSPAFMLRRFVSGLPSTTAASGEGERRTVGSKAQQHAGSWDGDRVAGGGHLDVASGARASIPLWLAAALHRDGVVQVEPHPLWSTEALMDFKADAWLPSVAQRSLRMYEVGAVSASFLASDEERRAQRDRVMLLYQRRLSAVLMHAASPAAASNARERLAVREAYLLNGALRDAVEKQAWFNM
mgnify:FL=1